MKNQRDIITEINHLTTMIESDYPELYQYLDENPDTIPSDPHPEINTKVMTRYLNNLKELLQSYIESHSSKLRS